MGLISGGGVLLWQRHAKLDPCALTGAEWRWNSPPSLFDPFGDVGQTRVAPAPGSTKPAAIVFEFQKQPVWSPIHAQEKKMTVG